MTTPNDTATSAGKSVISPSGPSVGIMPGAPTAAGTDVSTEAVGGAVGRKGVAAEAEQRAGGNSGAVTGVLHVNLQSCSLMDRSASDGVLHVLAFVGGNDTHGDGDRTHDFDHAGAGAESSTGVLVPDVLELAYAYGFRHTYEAIMNAATPAHSDVDADAGAAAGVDDKAVAESISVAKALRGRAAHTLLAVAGKDDARAKPPKDEAPSSSPPVSPSESDFDTSGRLATRNQLRYVKPLLIFC